MLVQPLKDYSIFVNNTFGKRRYRVKAKSLPKALKVLFKNKGIVKVEKVLINNVCADPVYLSKQIEKVIIWHEKNKAIRS